MIYLETSLLTGSLKFLIVFWKADRSNHFSVCRLLYIFSYHHILCCVGWDSKTFQICAIVWDLSMLPVQSVFCALWPWPLPSLQGHWGALGLASFSISTDTRKLVPRKWQVKGHLEGAGVDSVFSFSSNRRGRDAENASPEDGKSFCLGQNKVMWSKGVSHRGGLQTVIGCSQEFCLLIVA